MSFLESLLSLKLLVVLSASMGTSLPVGSLAAAVPRSEYFVGDVVTFRIPNSGELLTHRVVGVSSVSGVNGINPEVDASHRYGAGGVSGSKTYKTQGDANNVVDDWELTSDNIVGKVIFHLPYLGYLFRLPQIVLATVFR